MRLRSTRSSRKKTLPRHSASPDVLDDQGRWIKRGAGEAADDFRQRNLPLSPRGNLGYGPSSAVGNRGPAAGRT